MEPGDVLLARSGATVGKAFLVEKEAGVACHAGYLIRAQPNRSILHPAFFFAFTQSAGFTMWKDATFIIATIQNIGANRYADLPVPLPPLSEQELLLRFLDESTANSDRAVERAEVEIALLREYRTRLIADVVTGKLDVREAAARLPDKAEEPEPRDETDALIGRRGRTQRRPRRRHGGGHGVTTDTSERGLERLICTDLTGSPCDAALEQGSLEGEAATPSCVKTQPF